MWTGDYMKFLKLFKTLFLINLITFGGGYTIIPVIKNELVEREKLISNELMDKIIVLAQSIPGAMAISTSFLSGYYIYGFLGAIVALIASILPSMIIIILIAGVYKLLITNILIKNILNGLSASICAMLFLSVFQMFTKLYKKNRKYIYLSITLFAFILKFIFNLNVIYILIMGAIFGILINRGDKTC